MNWDAVAIESDGRMHAVIVVDVTQLGFRLQKASRLKEGSEILLDSARIPALRARIEWVSGDEAGGVFLDPIAL